eukprot:1203147-Prymnesium_polylepis.1
MDEPRGTLELTSVWRWSQFHRTPTQRAETSSKEILPPAVGSCVSSYRPYVCVRYGPTGQGTRTGHA